MTGPGAGNVLSAHGLRKDYGRDAARVQAVDDVDLQVAQGESVAIVGPSGCGKSTLLYLVGGLERPTAGTIELADGRIDGMPETGLARLRRHARELLAQVDLEDRAERLPSRLSGGQRQRVAIARALANSPLVELADEPTGSLDSVATTEVLRLFDHLRTGGQPLITVTHDSRVAVTTDRLISMRDGKFVDETRLTGGTSRSLTEMAGLEG